MSCVGLIAERDDEWMRAALATWYDTLDTSYIA